MADTQGENSQDAPFAGFQPSGLEPRISPAGFTAGIFTVLGISILTIIARIALRIQRSHSLAPDDYFLIVALITLIAACATQQAYRDLTYNTIAVETGSVAPTADFPKNSVVESAVLDATSVLLWTSIFCVKFSFLFFFRNLIARVRLLKIYWWVVLGLVLPSALVCIPLGFIECAYFGEDILAHCSVQSLIDKEKIYLSVTVVLDIFTDVLIISLPVALLWNVKIDLAKKLTLIGMFGLSIVMIIIAIIRVTMAPLTPTIMDTAWIFFWQILESSIALIMVSVSAFRGLFGQAGSSGGNSYAVKRNMARRAAAAKNDVEKGAQTGHADAFVAGTLPAKSPAHDDAFELRTVTPPKAHGTPIATITDEQPNQHRLPQPAPPTSTPATPSMGFQRAESPSMTICWSDNTANLRHERRRSLSRSNSRSGAARQMRMRSRTPSMGEALIEEKGDRLVPRDWL